MCPTPTGGSWHFSFNVKFYPPDPSQLTEDITRYLKVGYGIRGHLGRAAHLQGSGPRKSLHTSGPLTVIFSQLANKRLLNECEYETPGGARSCLFTAESSEIGCYFRLRDPWGKALRIEMQSATHHHQNGWDSAINDAAAPSVLL